MDIQEAIRKALENNELEKQMSVIRMEAVKQKISDETLQRMVEVEEKAIEVKRQAEEAKAEAQRREEEAKAEAQRKAAELRAKELELQQKAAEAARKNKYILWGVCAVLIILEWILIFNAHPAEGEKSHLILTLIVNFVTLLVVVIGAAVFFRKHN